MKSQISLALFDLAWPIAAVEEAGVRRQKERLQICLLRSIYTQLLRPLVFQSCGSNLCKPPSDKRSMRLTGLTYSTEQPHCSCTDNRGTREGGGRLTGGVHFGHLSTRRMSSHLICLHVYLWCTLSPLSHNKNMHSHHYKTYKLFQEKKDI